VVKDSFGNVVPRAAVRLTSRAGTIAPTAIESDSTGRALAVWTLAAKTVDQLLIASVRGANATDTLLVKASVPLSAAGTKQAGRPRRPERSKH